MFRINREQRRNAVKDLKKKGYTEEKAKTIIEMKEKIRLSEKMEEGQKVKLNIKAIKEYAGYSRLTEKYRKWVDDHTEDVFTVETYKEDDNRVCLAEDETDPKWLFWTGDLIKVKQ